MNTIPPGWHIEHDPKPIPDRSNDWNYWHDDYDGAPDGHDPRYGTAASYDDCLREITDCLEAQHAR